jgi:hypothetical protein
MAEQQAANHASTPRLLIYNGNSENRSMPMIFRNTPFSPCFLEEGQEGQGYTSQAMVFFDNSAGFGGGA